MRPASLLLTLSVLAMPASADPLQIQGTTGYAGEYELSGSVSEQDLNGKKEFSGPLTARHIGLCTRDGPKESIGEIRLELTQSSRISATLDFEGSKCTYKGLLSESYTTASWIVAVRAAFRSDFGPSDPKPVLAIAAWRCAKLSHRSRPQGSRTTRPACHTRAELRALGSKFGHSSATQLDTKQAWCACAGQLTQQSERLEHVPDYRKCAT